jgi:hypothetical protein
MIAQLGKAAGFKFGVHPHMLRHACGFKLAKTETKRCRSGEARWSTYMRTRALVWG